MRLLDAPFGALDNQTRALMQELLLGIWEANRKTVLFVTHDIDEAIFMANRVAVLTARPGLMWSARIVVTMVAAVVILTVLFVVWRENERRYAAFAMTGCFGDSKTSALGVSQECNGPRRLCRDAPPLLDWRHFCK